MMRSASSSKCPTLYTPVPLISESSVCALFDFSAPLSVRSLRAVFPRNSTSRMVMRGPSVTWNVTWTVLGLPAICATCGRPIKPFSAYSSRTTPRDPAQLTGVEERIEANLDGFLLQLRFDVRLRDLRQSFVVDDLDALPLLEVVHEHPGDHAIGERGVDHFHGEIVEELRIPQATEVLDDLLFNVVVVRDPLVS
jgi:hypothetical protein